MISAYVISRRLKKVAGVFVAVSIFWLFGGFILGGLLPSDPDEVLRLVKLSAASALDKFDLDSVSYPKAVLLDTLLDCVLRSVTDQEDDDETIPGWQNETDLSRVLKSTPAKTLRKMISKLHSDLKEKDDVISFLSQPIVNNHEFEYVHNASGACQGETLDFLFVVPSAPGYFERRENLRGRDLYRFAKNKTNKAKLLFFLGKPSQGSDAAIIQSRIDAEVEKYGDIVQDGFEDVYRNIRFKAVSMLKWSSAHCNGTRFVVRTDDDIRVDTERSLRALREKGERYANFILGHRDDNNKPTRKATHKFFVSTVEYPNDTYPPFAFGAFLGYPISTVGLLYQAALRVEPLWMEDVYLTGICAPKVGVPVLRHPDFDFEHAVY